MRNTNITLSLLVAAPLFFLQGCGGGHEAHSEDDGHDHSAHSADDGHDHGSGESDGHAEGGDADEHEHAGETHELGSVTAAGTTLDVTITGDVEPGAELHVGLEPSGGSSPGAIRLWVGVESGVGSLKAKANSHGDHFDGHVEVPEGLAAGAKLWLQVESSTGESEVKSLDLP